MNSVIHAKISVRKRGGRIEDYLAIHDFMDSTKELCSDNRHRILHTLWGIRRVVVPVFGHTLINSDGKEVNVKDLCEQDHILPDYQNRFIPTLEDFVTEIEPEAAAQHDFEAFAASYSLLITHNSWFVNEIVPKIFRKPVEIKDFGISPGDLFNHMAFRLWMDNGSAFPGSCRLTAGKIVG